MQFTTQEAYTLTAANAIDAGQITFGEYENLENTIKHEMQYGVRALAQWILKRESGDTPGEAQLEEARQEGYDEGYGEGQELGYERTESEWESRMDAFTLKAGNVLKEAMSLLADHVDEDTLGDLESEIRHLWHEEF